jgi:hypothetical protein
VAHRDFEVKYYQVNLSTNILSSGVTVVGFISCHDASTNWSSTQVIYFVPDGISLPPPTYSPSVKVGAMYRPISQFGIFIDLLRNERPLHAHMDDTVLALNSLETTRSWP